MASEKHPPQLAKKILYWFLRNDLAEEVVGDLDENFAAQQKSTSSFRAKLNYWYQVVNYLRPFALKKSNPYSIASSTLLKHIVLISYRNNLRYRSSFFINLLGLTVGLTGVLLIYLWVTHELAMDKFHSNDRQLYQAMLHHHHENEIQTGPDTQALLAASLQEEVPEIELACQDTDPNWFDGNFVVTNGTQFLKKRGKFSGSNYFRLFSFAITHGHPDHLMADKNSIVLSQQLAIALFGDAETAMGKTVQWHLLNFKGDAKVTGVFADIGPNSSEQFDFVLPFQLFEDILGDGIHWGNHNALTYVQVKEGTAIDTLNARLSNYIKQKADSVNVTLFFRPYSDKYLYNKYENGKLAGGRISYVHLFSILAGFILLIACINYMNLTTARASRRLKEVGIKKSLGVSRWNLLIQYMGESVTINVLALALALGFTALLLPEFNYITGKQLYLNADFELLAFLATVGIVTGIISGSYPALYLSGFNPAVILKGKLNTTFGELWARKGLVIFQFMLSIVLIFGVLVVSKQVEYIQTKNMGFNRDNVVLFSLEGTALENMDDYLHQLKIIPGVLNASTSAHRMESSSYTTGVEWEGKSPDTEIRFENITVYYDFIETMSVSLKEGRAFAREFKNESENLIFNETAIRAMGITDPIGKKVKLWGEEKTIVGVVNDFNYATIHQKVEPQFFRFNDKLLPYMLVKIENGEEKETLSRLEKFHQSVNPGYAFSYSFMDQRFQQQYAAEIRVATISKYFAALAILISCLGLFGLASFTAERRQKEIGIRKIMGSGEWHIIYLLSKDFTGMILVAILIGLPLSFFTATHWLSNFAYHITLEWWYFALSALCAMVVAWITVGTQTILASKINPVQSLRIE